MKSKLFFILVLFLFPLTGQALVLTGADLIGLDQPLTITENTQITITDDITWNGAINVGGGFTVDFLNQGSLRGDVAINSYDSSVFNLQNAGSITANLNFATSGGALNTIDNSSGSLSGYLNFNINSGSVSMLAGGFIGAPSVAVQNSGGIFDLQNNGYIGSAFNITNTGAGVVNFQNNGTSSVDLNFYTYGADTTIINNGWLSGTLNILDQHDVTKIINTGTISSSTLNLTVNGSQGSIQIQNNGVIGNGSEANIDANYGGEIDINTIFGTLDLSKLGVSADGASHGVDSSFLMLYSENVAADELRVYGALQDTSFLAAGLDREFASPVDGSIRAVFDNVNSSPVPVPAPALLLGSSLIGLWGARKLRGCV